MKNKQVGKKIGTVFSIIAALVVAFVFWLFVEYIDSDQNASTDTAYVETLSDTVVL